MVNRSEAFFGGDGPFPAKRTQTKTVLPRCLEFVLSISIFPILGGLRNASRSLDIDQRVVSWCFPVDSSTFWWLSLYFVCVFVLVFALLWLCVFAVLSPLVI